MDERPETDESVDGVAPHGGVEVAFEAAPEGFAARLPEGLRRADARLVTVVRRRPLATLGGAVLFGYLLGRILRRWT